MGRRSHGPGILLLMRVMEAIKASDDRSTRELISSCRVTSYAFYEAIRFLEKNRLVFSEVVRTRERGRGRIKIYRLTPAGDMLYRVLREYIKCEGE